MENCYRFFFVNLCEMIPSDINNGFLKFFQRKNLVIRIYAGLVVVTAE